MYYINYFFIMSIFGHFTESVFFSTKGSGILLSYWTPIYGIGTIIILIIYKCVNKVNLKRFYKFVTFFIICTCVLAIIEAIGGYLIRWIFNKELWNYKNQLLNIGRYTSLKMALVWGICSVLFIYIIKPILDKLIKKIPKIFGIVCITLFFIDIISTIIIKT